MINTQVSPALQENMHKLEMEMKRDSLNGALRRHIFFYLMQIINFIGPSRDEVEDRGFIPPENIAPAIEDKRRSLKMEFSKIELKKQLSSCEKPHEQP